jgi:L-fuconolactonase
MSLTRRDAVKSLALSLAAALPGCAADSKRDEEAPAPPLGIDAHTHFYDPMRPQGVPWPAKDDAKLYRTVLPPEFLKLAAPLGIGATVVVEASPWLEDNQWLLNLAADHRSIWGVVGNLAPGTPEFPGHVKRFAKNPLFKGIRVNYQGEDKSGSVLGDDLARLVDADLALDLNGPPIIVNLAAKIAERHPKLRIVINHLGNLVIDGKPPPQPWLDAMKAAAGHPNVFCKASACVEGAHAAGPPPATRPGFYAPVLDAAYAAFGPDRLLYAGNWPVSALFADYETVHRIAANFIAPKGPAAAAKFFHHNALAAYRCAPR